MLKIIILAIISFYLYASSFQYKETNSIQEVIKKCDAKEVLYNKEINESDLSFHLMIPNFKGSFITDNPGNDKRSVAIILNSNNQEKWYLVPQYYRWDHAYPYEITTYGNYLYQDYLKTFEKETDILVTSYEENIKIVDRSWSIKTIDENEEETIYNLDYKFYFNYDNKYLIFTSNGKIQVLSINSYKNIQEFIGVPENKFFDILIIDFN